MRDELQRYLDGEIALDALPQELRDEAARWDALLGSATELRDEVAPPWMESAVMARLPDRRTNAWSRALAWLLEPRPLQVRPAAALALVLAVALGVTFWPRTGETPPVPGTVAEAGGESVVYVQFVYAGNDAGSVSVAGDFNEWQPDEYLLSDTDGDGVWTGLFPVSPGVHKYMFVVDGQRWVTDPNAARTVDDGFGMRNAILSVSAGRAL